MNSESCDCISGGIKLGIAAISIMVSFLLAFTVSPWFLAGIVPGGIYAALVDLDDLTSGPAGLP